MHMERLKRGINGYFEAEEECLPTLLSRKLADLMDLIDLSKVEKRFLPKLMVEYLEEDRAKIYETSKIALGAVKSFQTGEDGFEQYSDKLLKNCLSMEDAEVLLKEIEEILLVIKDGELNQNGAGIDLERIEFELGERLKEKKLMVLTKEEKVNLLEPLLMEECGEIDSARELIKARVDQALEQIKKTGKNKFFYVPAERLEAEKEKLKAIKRFAKEKLPKKNKIRESETSEDDQISNP